MNPETLSTERAEGPGQARRRPPRPSAKVRAVDFSRPTKFTAEQERRVGRSLEAFCRAATTRLSAELRVSVDLDTVAASQLNWSAAHAAVPGDAICALLEAQPMGSTLLLGVERPFVLQAIDLLLGGTVGVAPRERRLTEIDWALAEHVLRSLVAQLSIIWKDVAGVELGVARLETQLESSQVAAVSEPTLSLTLEARLGQATSTMVLLVPHQAVESVIEAFSGEDGRRSEDARSEREAMCGALEHVDMALRAEVAAVELTAAELLALRPGDLLRLDGQASAGITLLAGDVPVCRARPGRSGRRRAVQVLEPLTQEQA